MLTAISMSAIATNGVVPGKLVCVFVCVCVCMRVYVCVCVCLCVNVYLRRGVGATVQSSCSFKPIRF